MTATQTSVAAGGEPAATEHVTFWFQVPTQEEVAAQLDALDRARHTTHTQPARLCPLCGWGREA